MRNFLLSLSFVVFSSSSFATGNFSSETGSLVIRNLNVDGTTICDTVKLQLNLANGTFTILDTTKQDTPSDAFISKTVIDTLVKDNVKIDFMGCIISFRDQQHTGNNQFITVKQQITCKTEIVSLIETQGIHVVGNYSSNLVDNLGNEYKLTTAIALDQSAARLLQINAIQGIPVAVKFIYDNVDPSATSISEFKFEVVFSNPKFNIIEANFKDTDTLSPFK